MKLDTKRAFGHVVGDASGAVFEQDGRMFNADHDEVTSNAKVSNPAPKPDTVGEGEKKGFSFLGKKAGSAVDSQIAAQGA